MVDFLKWCGMLLFWAYSPFSIVRYQNNSGKYPFSKKKNTVESPNPQNIQCVCMEEPQDCNIIWRGIITHTAKYLVLRLFLALYFFLCCINIWTHIKKPVINESLWAYVFIVRNNGQYSITHDNDEFTARVSRSSLENSRDRHCF